MKTCLFKILSISLLLFIVSCNKNNNIPESNTPLKYASGLVIAKEKNYIIATVKDPWNSGKVLQTYILVPRDKNLPDKLPQGIVVKIPLQNVLVYSDVHAGVIKELGVITAIKSVCDAEYFKTPEIISGLKNNSVTDCGSSSAPTIERVISTNPEAILLSPFQNAGFGALGNTGIPIIQLADYMEHSPLGRAEWIKFIGLLFNKSVEADSIFDKVEHDYEALKILAKNVSERPRVISETVTGGIWYVPGGNSYKACLYKDAGADYPWAENQSSGSLSLDFPQVLAKAKDADIWLITTFGNELTSEGLLSIYPHNNQFSAFANHRVYYANTAVSRLFDETPFHPELLLKEYIKIFHSELLHDYRLRYYKPMKY